MEGNEVEEGEENNIQAEVEDDLETAFGILDSVKVILSKMQPTEEVKLKLAGIYSTLGEVLTEDGMFDLACVGRRIR